MSSSDDLSAQQLRAIAAKAGAFRDYVDKARERGRKLGWPADDPLFNYLGMAWEKASWLAVHCATRATEKEGKG